MSDQKIFIAPFVGGINTELTTVEELPVNTSDELNCTIFPERIRGRRYGFDIERDGQLFPVTIAQSGKILEPIDENDPDIHKLQDVMFSAFYWKNVGKTDLDILVVQAGWYLYFFSALNKPFEPVSRYQLGTIKSFVNLEEYVVDKALFNQNRVNMTTGDGTLIVVSKYLRPVRIVFDEPTQSFSVSEIELMYRDFEGVDDGLGIEDTPSSLTRAHNYNLTNQGWTISAINQYYTDTGVYPSNNLQWFIGKDNSGQFNTQRLLQTYFGNSAAPRGHYILEYFTRFRSAAAGIYSGAARKATYNYNKFDIKNRSLVPYPVSSITLTFPNSKGIAVQAYLTFNQIERKSGKRNHVRYKGRTVYYVEGLNNNGNWVQLATRTSIQGTDHSTPIDFSWQNTTVYKQYRIRALFSKETDQNYSYDTRPYNINAVAEMPIGSDGDAFPYTGPNWRVTDVAFLGGRYFYLAGDTVLFSQVVDENNNGYDKCYQDADPTSEEISDMLPTDGGVIRFKTMGDGASLITFNRGVLVFGRDVVYVIASPSDGLFTATDYDIVELSRAGICGPKSPVSTGDSVYYWSPMGIYKIGVNQYTGSSLVAQNITQPTIQSFYNNISQFSKDRAVGCFDYTNNRIYWYYPTNEDFPWSLDGCLVYDLNYNAFMPQKISVGSGTGNDEGGEIQYLSYPFQVLSSYQIVPTQWLRAGDMRVVASEDGMKDGNGNTITVSSYPEYLLESVGNPGTFTKVYYDTVNDKYFPWSTIYNETQSDDDWYIVWTDGYAYETDGSIVDFGDLPDSKRYTITATGEYKYSYQGISESQTPDYQGVTAVDETNKYNRYVSIQHLITSISKEDTDYRLKVGFGDYNSREFIDFSTNPFNSYMVSRPINVQDTYFNKQAPIMQTLFKRTEEAKTTKKNVYISASGAMLRIRWGWSQADKSNRWDIVQNGYRPQKDFLYDEYVESRLHVRGRGKAFQVEISNDYNKDFRLAGINLIVRV